MHKEQDTLSVQTLYKTTFSVRVRKKIIDKREKKLCVRVLSVEEQRNEWITIHLHIHTHIHIDVHNCVYAKIMGRFFRLACFSVVNVISYRIVIQHHFI